MSGEVVEFDRHFGDKTYQVGEGLRINRCGFGGVVIILA